MPGRQYGVLSKSAVAPELHSPASASQAHLKGGGHSILIHLLSEVAEPITPSAFPPLNHLKMNGQDRLEKEREWVSSDQEQQGRRATCVWKELRTPLPPGPSSFPAGSPPEPLPSPRAKAREKKQEMRLAGTCAGGIWAVPV